MVVTRLVTRSAFSQKKPNFLIIDVNPWYQRTYDDGGRPRRAIETESH